MLEPAKQNIFVFVNQFCEARCLAMLRNVQTHVASAFKKSGVLAAIAAKNRARTNANAGLVPFRRLLQQSPRFQ